MRIAIDNNSAPLNPYWHDSPDYRYEYAATADPRVFAVTVRDDDPSAPYGDGLAPAYWLDYRSNWGSYDAREAGDVFHDADSREIAESIARAYSHAPDRRNADEFAERYARIFHDTVFTTIDTQDSRLIILSTPTYREHVGGTRAAYPGNRMPWDGFNVSEGSMGGVGFSADEYLSGELEEWDSYLNGEVYGAGYATVPGRVIDDGEMPHWEDIESAIEIECWGLYGADYARESAFNLEYGSPDLPTMLDIDAI